MTEPLTFSFEELDITYTNDADFEPKVIETFRHYLRPDDSLSLRETVRSIVDLLPEASEWSDELETFWHLCLDVVAQIPHYHTFHLKLVRLVLALRHSPKTSFIVPVNGTTGPQYVQEFNLLGQVMRERYQPAYDREDLEGTSGPEHARRWINTNAFYANLHSLNGGTVSIFCTWAMRDTFGWTPSTDYEALDCLVPAAAQWIIISGQNIFRETLFLVEERKLLGDKQPWTLDSWHRWRDGFQKMSEEINLQAETRSTAKRVADLMDALEKVK